MKISRIALFVLGSSGADSASGASRSVPYAPSELWRDISDGIRQLCEDGSEEAVCSTLFDGQSFQRSLSSVIGQVRSSSRSIVAGVQATRLYVIHLVNSALSAPQWAQGIARADAEVRGMGFAQINHIAIIQKDDLAVDDPELVRVLDDTGAAIYLFSQSTRAGWVLSSGNEERKLLSHYAILAAAGQLPENHAIYTGTYNKLSLMEEDFRRLRIHYAVCALTNRLRGVEPPMDENALFSVFFGAWIGNKDLDLKSDYEVVGLSLKSKLVPLFPSQYNASIMANTSTRAIDANIDRFLEVNFRGPWFKALLDRFDEAPVMGQQVYSPASILGEWCAHFDSVMEQHPEYYCRETVDFLRKELMTWLDNRAQRLRASPPAPVQCEEKDPIAYAVIKTERSLRPYYNQAAAALLMGICRLLEARIESILERIHTRDRIISQNHWLLSDGELSDDRRFAETIMSRIENNSRTTIQPEFNMVPSSAYFGEERDVADNWVKLVDRLQRQLVDRNEQSLVSYLGNDVSAAEFTEAVTQQVQDLGERLPVNPAQIYPELRKVIYICSDQLHVDNTSRRLPRAGDLCTTVTVRRFDNLIEFSVYGICRSDNAPAQIAELMGIIGNSRRMEEIGGSVAFDPLSDEGAAPEKDEQKEVMHTAFEVRGNQLCITLPMAFFRRDDVRANLKYVLSGYNADSTRANPVTRTQHVEGRMINIPLGTFYGHCRIELSCSALDYHEVHEFDGQKVQRALMYSKKRPRVLNRQKTVSINGDRMSFEHWICRLMDDNVRSIAALATLNAGPGVPLYYPIGESGQWDIWLPGEVSGDFYLAPGDEARVYTMEEME